jgi:hypothetical protein
MALLREESDVRSHVAKRSLAGAVHQQPQWVHLDVTYTTTEQRGQGQAQPKRGRVSKQLQRSSKRVEQQQPAHLSRLHRRAAQRASAKLLREERDEASLGHVFSACDRGRCFADEMRAQQWEDAYAAQMEEWRLEEQKRKDEEYMWLEAAAHEMQLDATAKWIPRSGDESSWRDQLADLAFDNGSHPVRPAYSCSSSASTTTEPASQPCDCASPTSALVSEPTAEQASEDECASEKYDPTQGLDEYFGRWSRADELAEAWDCDCGGGPMAGPSRVDLSRRPVRGVRLISCPKRVTNFIAKPRSACSVQRQRERDVRQPTSQMHSDAATPASR